MSGGAAVFKTQDETREMLKKHPRVVVPVPLTSLPVLPPISAIRRATDEDSGEFTDLLLWRNVP